MTNTAAKATSQAREKDDAAAQNEQTATLVAGPHEPAPEVKDADSPASKPQGTLRDQVTTMESEGQAQPQSDDQPPEATASGIPPLPAPAVEGVGEERGPSAGKTDETIARARGQMAGR